MPNSRPLMNRVKQKMQEKVDIRNLLPGFDILFEDDADKQDLYSTPWWATSILFEHTKFTGSIWECACGLGRMSECIADRQSEQVISTDLIDRNYGKGEMDFLELNELLGDNIVTNPPYSFAKDFVYHALELRPLKAAFLLRTLFLDTGTRYELFKQYPPRKVIVISDRVMFDGSEKPGGCWCLSWFVWERDYRGPTELEWGRWSEANCV